MAISQDQPSSEIHKVLDRKKTTWKNKHYTCEPNKITDIVSFDLDKSIESYEPKVETRVSHEIFPKKYSPMERAREIQANLGSKFPSFVKNLLPSHVTGGFWLGLPKNFTRRYLPKHDETVVLVEEETQLEHETKYLAAKNGLSGGWRGFSISHKLQEKDVLVFHLIQQCKFKVYIVRINAFTEIDGAISFLNFGACTKEMVRDRQKKDLKITVMAREEHLEQYFKVHSVQENDMIDFSNNAEAAENHSGMDIDYYVGIRFSQSAVNFQDVKTFDNFNIIVYGFIIDCEIPQHLRVKYYELCRSQKSYLHDQLTDGLELQLVVGVILETINAAEAIRSSTLTSSENLKIWDNTLKAFEVLGMKVGFLRARINKLVTLSSDSKDALKCKILEKVKAEEELKALILKKVTAEEEMKALKIKLISVKKMIGNSDYKIEYMKRRAERLEAVFLEESTAPW